MLKVWGESFARSNAYFFPQTGRRLTPLRIWEYQASTWWVLCQPRSLPSLNDLTFKCSCKDRDLQSFIFPSSWDIAMSSVCPSHPPREDNAARNLNSVICFIKGPKNSGKSTFARTLINKLTNRWARQVIPKAVRALTPHHSGIRKLLS